jgi:geranylgeranyl diphosphate synthase type I
MTPEPTALAVHPFAGADHLGNEVEGALAVIEARRALFDQFLRAAVATLPDSVDRIAGYHLGWLDEHGDPVVANSGKAIRPTMALLASEAVGGGTEVALPAAAAVELAHNFSLIHDDVIDGDETRRHRPTAWSVFGVGAAIVAGDALLALAYGVLAASGHHAAAEVAAMLSAAVIGLSEGQSQDLSFERRSDVDLSECLGMVERKTALLMSCACTSGAAFGGGRPAQLKRMRSVGRHFGLAFQLVDDLLGIWGDPAVTGKPVYSDLQNRKKTVPVVVALTSGTDASRELANLYHRDGELSDRELARAAELIERAGARAWTEAQLKVFVSRALRDLDLAEPTVGGAAGLRSLGCLITSQQP